MLISNSYLIVYQQNLFLYIVMTECNWHFPGKAMMCPAGDSVLFILVAV